MQREKNRMRPEYLWCALMCMIVALFIVLLIVLSSCRSNGKKEESSEGVSSLAAVSIPEAESSEESLPTSFHTVEVNSADKTVGLLALTTLTGTDAPKLDDLPTISSLMEQNDPGYGLANNALTLRKEAVEALNRFTKAFKGAKGQTYLMIQKAYTEASELTDAQKATEVDLTNGYTIKFGFSKPDPDGEKLGTGKYLWLVDNCNNYGYILRYPADKASITKVDGGSSLIYRYVGYEHASYMGRYHICLEEYIDLLHSSTPESPLSITYQDASGTERTCEVYYIAASSGEKTTLKIRGDESTLYQVSGDGKDGFIVTCYPS